MKILRRSGDRQSIGDTWDRLPDELKHLVELITRRPCPERLDGRHGIQVFPVESAARCWLCGSTARLP